MDLNDRPSLDQLLINDWQRGFPLDDAPFAHIARQCGHTETAVLDAFRRLGDEGCVSRIGAVWAPGAGGAAMLCALAVPAARLDEVAARINAVEGVNHNYEREHPFNLWFVITGRDKAAIHQQVDRLDADTGLRALRLPMVRPYRIDLGFDLRRVSAPPHPGEALVGRARGMPVAADEMRLAALAEEGLPLLPRPYAAWSQAIGWPLSRIRETLDRWLARGTLRRFGVIVRHHDLGIRANAMTVVDVPDALVDEAGARLAGQAGVTLCYRRERHADWPYNLYFMVHGHDRQDVGEVIDAALRGSGLLSRPRQTLFSARRFKQTGGRYFRPDAAPMPREEARHGHAA